MKTSKLALLTLVAFLIGGCAWGSRNLAASQAAQAAQEQQQRDAYRAQLAGNCDAMGFQRDTAAHSNCMLSLYQQDQRNRGAAAAAILQGAAAAEIQRNSTTDCKRDYFGNVRCTSR